MTKYIENQGCIPLTKELRMDMARLEIPVSGWTCLRTGKRVSFDESWMKF